MATTLQTIKDRLELRLKDINGVSNDILYMWATDLNQMLYRQLCNVDPERFITSTTYTVSSSPSTQALPAAFNDVSVKGTGFFVQNPSGTDTTEQLVITGLGSIEKGYYISATNVIFTGINTTTTIKLRYIPVISDIDSLSDSFIVPDEYKELLEEGMVLRFYRRNEDPRESTSDFRFARLLSEFISRVRKTPKAYGLPDFSIYY